MAKVKILVVDDERLLRWSFQQDLEKEGYEVFLGASGEEGLELVKRELPDLAILDIRLPGMDGIELLKEIKEVNPATLVIMMTAHGAIETAVRAMKEGAYDYIAKPVNFDELNLLIRKALKTLRLQEEVSWLRRQRSGGFEPPSVIGSSQIMRELRDLISKVATGDTVTVLLEGESGTGKDLFARTIHHLSQRRSQPFLDINCSAVQETLVESELFGYEKGAFTDAKTLKKGLFELAEGGTLYLDEISGVSLGSQVKLLKFIENRCFRRVGGIKDIHVDVRIIAASNQDLRESVRQGKFREDLYFRLRVIPIDLPPLRARQADIPALVGHFIRRFSDEFGKKPMGISEEAMRMLVSYPWPGNIRELRNVMERIMLLETHETILAEHLPLEIRCTDGSLENNGFLGNHLFPMPDAGISMEGVEKQLLQRALAAAKGNQTQAARLLKLSRDTFRYRMKKFGFS